MTSNHGAARQAAAQRAALEEQVAVKAALHATNHGHGHHAKATPGLVSTVVVICVLALAIASFVALVFRG